MNGKRSETTVRSLQATFAMRQDGKGCKGLKGKTITRGRRRDKGWGDASATLDLLYDLANPRSINITSYLQCYANLGAYDQRRYSGPLGQSQIAHHICISLLIVIAFAAQCPPALMNLGLTAA